MWLLIMYVAEAKKVWHNPFDPPERALTVGYLGPGHTLVLNKFNVVAHHCLVSGAGGSLGYPHVCHAHDPMGGLPLPVQGSGMHYMVRCSARMPAAPF
jgi:hypothetical protein